MHSGGRSKILRTLQPGEEAEALGLPREDTATKLSRVQVSVNGTVGWVTIQGNQGTVRTPTGA